MKNVKIDSLEYYNSVKDYLASIPLLRDLPEEKQLEIVSQSNHREFQKDDEIFSEGENVHAVLVIRTGRVKLVRYDIDGKEHILDILHNGDAIWETLFSEDGAFPYSAVAMADTRLCEIDTALFTEIFKNDPDMTFNMIKMLSQKLREADEKLVLMAIKDPVSRLAQFLLSKDLSCVTADICLKLDDIAASIGLRPETVSRAIKQLENEDLICRAGQGRIRVLDRDGLKDFSTWE